MMSATVSPAVIADTHTLIWSLFEPSRLSVAAKRALADAEAAGAPIYISSVSIVELRYLVEKGKFTEADLTLRKQPNEIDHSQLRPEAIRSLRLRRDEPDMAAELRRDYRHVSVIRDFFSFERLEWDYRIVL